MSKKTDFVNQEYYTPFLGGGRTSSNPEVAKTLVIRQMYERIFTELAMARFEWKGLPDSVSPRFLEMALFTNGLAVYYDDTDFGQLALHGTTASGQLDHYGDPISFRVMGVNSRINKTIKRSECVPIWSNALRRTDLDIVKIYAERISQIDRTVEINSENARATKFVIVDENQLLTADNIVRQINEGRSAIKVKSSFDVQAMIQAVDLDQDPKGIETLDILSTRQYNRCMGLLGINNANQDKKERLVESEVNGNDDQIQAMRQVNLNARQLAARQISKMFGGDVSVDFYKGPELEIDLGAPGFDNGDNDVSRETSEDTK